MKEKEKKQEQGTGVTEELNAWIPVIRPGLLLLGAALLLVAAAVLVWGFTGSLPVTETFGGFVTIPDADRGTEVLCFVDASRFYGAALEGHEARVTLGDGSVFQGNVSFYSDTPQTAQAHQAEYDIPDWMMSRLMAGDYLYAVGIELEESAAWSASQLASVSIVVREVKPISFLMR